jgi:hypothetical protein
MINNKLRHDQFYLPNLAGLEATAVYHYLQNDSSLLFVSAHLPPSFAIIPVDFDQFFFHRTIL